MHLSHTPQYTIRTKNDPISLLNGALWDMGQVHCGYCETGIFGSPVMTIITHCYLARMKLLGLPSNCLESYQWLKLISYWYFLDIDISYQDSQAAGWKDRRWFTTHDELPKGVFVLSYFRGWKNITHVMANFFSEIRRRLRIDDVKTSSNFWHQSLCRNHYNDVIMGAIAS